MEQSGSEWHDFRRAGIGSSDAPVVMGASKWKTADVLLREKLGLLKECEPNFAMMRGTRMEPQARAHYELNSDIEMPPALVIHPVYPFIRASLDGINLHARKILEIKCPGRVDHKTAELGRIPEKYKWQLVHQLLVTELDQVHYYSYKDGKGVLVTFDRDKHLEEELFEKEFAFWETVVTQKEILDSSRSFIGFK